MINSLNALFSNGYFDEMTPTTIGIDDTIVYAMHHRFDARFEVDDDSFDSRKRSFLALWVKAQLDQYLDFD